MAIKDNEAFRAMQARLADLLPRWGNSEEASLDQRTMDVCLSEVKRSRAVSPRPNFIILLGERYGWLPPPPHIPDAHFRAMLGRLTPGQRELLRDWYTRDGNTVPPSN